MYARKLLQLESNMKQRNPAQLYSLLFSKQRALRDLNGASLGAFLLELGSRQHENPILEIGTELLDIDIVANSEALVKASLRGGSILGNLASTINVEDLAVVLNLNLHIRSLDTWDINRNVVLAVFLLDVDATHASKGGRRVGQESANRRSEAGKDVVSLLAKRR